MAIECSATAATGSPGPSPANSDSKLTRASATGSRCALGRPDAATSSSSLLATGSSATRQLCPARPPSEQAGVRAEQAGSDPQRSGQTPSVAGQQTPSVADPVRCGTRPADVSG